MIDPVSRLGPGDPFLLGVNYWPCHKAMYWWSRFSPDEVRKDFAQIRALGLSVVRIFLLWEEIQPSPERISERVLDALEQVCDAAAEHELVLDLTFFTGHMSGPSWTPSWMLLGDEPMPAGLRQVVSAGREVNCAYRNPFVDELVIQAAELQLRTVVSRLAGHPAIWAWNLGNEPDLFARPPDAERGRRWIKQMVEQIRAVDPRHPVTCGLYSSSLTEDNGLRVDQVCAELDFAAIHGYPMYEPWIDDPLDPDYLPFLCALSGAFCGKPILMEEFGGCTMPPGQASGRWQWRGYGRSRRKFLASEQDLARFLDRVLERLVDVGAAGALLWCFSDYATELYHRPPCDHSRHERHFGLLRPDGSLKPHAEVLRRFAAAKPTVTPAAKTYAPGLSAAAYYADPLANAQRLFQRFRR